MLFHTVEEKTRDGMMRENDKCEVNHISVEVPENETRAVRAEAIENNKIQKKTLLDSKS